MTKDALFHGLAALACLLIVGLAALRLDHVTRTHSHDGGHTFHTHF